MYCGAKGKAEVACDPVGTRYGPYGARPGVERPDEDIRSDITAAILADKRVDPANLLVSVREGVAFLSGMVGTNEQRGAAEEDAFDTPGVVDVHNELQTRDE
jgi:osmotically-inducible protein OsmY